ncbi:MAG: HAMP domain-containing protein [Acidobacteria bacterium]|nr:HAMP domain-containing protein [Acidobacteriota bacterium]
MTRRLLVGYLSLTAFILVILEIPLGVTFARHEQARLLGGVERDGAALASLAEDLLEHEATVLVAAPFERYARQTGGRVVIVDRRGASILDTDHPEGPARDFSTRPEVAAALRGETNSGTRYSRTLGLRLLYVAVPVSSAGTVHGVIRITYPMGEVDRRIARNWMALGIIALVVLAAISLVGWLLARSVTRPLDALERAATSVAGGDLAARSPAGTGPPEVRALARTFNEMAARLQDLVTAQRRFVADASHQLRTPLTGLRLRLENLDPGIDPASGEDLEGAIAESERLSRLVDGLLALARAEGARPERATVDVGEVAGERCRTWEPLAEESGVALRLEVPAARPLLAGAVRGYLEQILDNLLANAIEAAPEGAEIIVRAEREGDRVALHVVDSGPGMTEEQRARAFDPFWRGEGSAPGGSGLGLAIVRQLAVACGGDVDLAAAVGLDVVVRLPAGGPA